MKISLIAAVAENNVIGKDNDLIWHLPNDLKYFKKITLGHHIVLGRKNYLSIPEKYRPLPNRKNIVLTRNPEFKAEGCIVLNSLESAIEYAKNQGEEELFIIGGGEIYKQALDKNLINRLYITHVHESFEGDTFFPHINYDEWKLVSKECNLKDEKHPHDFTFCIYEK
ncbi:MAG TPA: diacylglycerol kinase [Flavobacteriales bacterium]|nr:diacylglycerol kinase [Flavobacteriales bacterium]|tara:strand:- start:58390 stop:58893 length:504 start_codon:yes stop_codon:yes gene_type:complete